LKRLTINASVHFTDDSRNLAHQTVVENLLVKMVKNFKAELNAIKGVQSVWMDARVKQTKHVTPETSGLAALGGEGPTGPKSILPHIMPDLKETTCVRCGLLFTTMGCTKTVCNYKKGA